MEQRYCWNVSLHLILVIEIIFAWRTYYEMTRGIFCIIMYVSNHTKLPWRVTPSTCHERYCIILSCSWSWSNFSKRPFSNGHDYKNKELHQLYVIMSVSYKGTLLLQVTPYYTPIMAIGFIDILNFLILRPNIVQRQHGLFALTARLPRRSLAPELSKDISQVGRAIFFGNKWIVNLHAWLTVLDHKISCWFLTIRLSLYHHNYSTIE